MREVKIICVLVFNRTIIRQMVQTFNLCSRLPDLLQPSRIYRIELILLVINERIALLVTDHKSLIANAYSRWESLIQDT